MSLFQVTKKQVIENYELRTMTGDIVSFTPSYSQLLPDPFSDLNVTVNVVATGGNGTPDNPNPIVGYSSANITRCGVNLWDEVTESGRYNSSTGNKESESGYICTSNRIIVKEGTTYKLVKPNGLFMRVVYYNNDGTFNSSPDIIHTYAEAESITIPSGVGYLCFNILTETYGNNISFNYPSSETSYHPYNGQTYAISFGQTVYGGVLDVTRGKLTVTHVCLDLGEQAWTYKSSGSVLAPYFYCDITGVKFEGNPATTTYHFICSDYVTVRRDISTFVDDTVCFDGSITEVTQIQIKDSNYTDAGTFTTAMSGKQLVYELGTPFDIDLTPEVISAIVGTNNVFADCGDVTVKCLI